MSFLYPTLLRNRITDITEEDLRALGVRGLLLDVDNTLTEHYCPDLPPAVAEWLSKMQAAGVTMTVISNAKQYRVVPFAQKLGMQCVWLAAKPLPFGLWRGVRRLGLRRRECAVVGDQTFTDILGAKLGGFQCVQVLPMRLEEDKPFFVFKRRLESRILKRYRKKEKVT